MVGDTDSKEYAILIFMCANLFHENQWLELAAGCENIISGDVKINKMICHT